MTRAVMSAFSKLCQLRNLALAFGDADAAGASAAAADKAALHVAVQKCGKLSHLQTLELMQPWEFRPKLQLSDAKQMVQALQHHCCLYKLSLKGLLCDLTTEDRQLLRSAAPRVKMVF